jgi:hypothetical protein
MSNIKIWKLRTQRTLNVLETENLSGGNCNVSWKIFTIQKKENKWSFLVCLTIWDLLPYLGIRVESEAINPSKNGP